MLKARSLVSAILGSVLLLSAVGALAPAGANPGAPASVALVRGGSGTIPYTGGTTTLPLVILDVANLGAATVQIGYDRSVISPTACARGADFTGDNFVWICNRFYDEDEDGLPDAVRIVSTALHGISATAGLPLNLAAIAWTLQGAQAPGQVITLEVSAPTLADSDAVPIPHLTENGQIVLAPVYFLHLPLVMR